MTTPAEKDAMALAAIAKAAHANPPNVNFNLEAAGAHLAARVADQESTAAMLREELASLRTYAAANADRASRAEAELAAAKVDAERYRWLAKNSVRSASNCFRSRGQELNFLFDHLWDDTLDAAIDAARGGSGGGT